MPEVIQCPICEADVVDCDNNIWLDHPAQEWNEYPNSWTLMEFGHNVYATNGDPSPDGKGHSLHEHQAKGSVLNP